MSTSSPLDVREQAATSLVARLRFYFDPFDGRYEDLREGHLTV